MDDDDADDIADADADEEDDEEDHGPGGEESLFDLMIAMAEADLKLDKTTEVRLQDRRGGVVTGASCFLFKLRKRSLLIHCCPS